MGPIMTERVEVKMKRCFFIGHRDTPEAVFPALCAAVEQHVMWGVTEFIVGSRGAYDRLATDAIVLVKQRHPRVRLIRLLSYLPTGDEATALGFDGSVYPAGLESTPPVYAIVRANQWAVDNATHLIAYVRYS